MRFIDEKQSYIPVGITVKVLEQDLRSSCDLYTYDGLPVIFMGNVNNSNMLLYFFWADESHQYYLASKISEATLHNLVLCVLPLKEAILSADEMHLLKVNAQWHIDTILNISNDKNNIPDSFLPVDGVMISNEE